MVLRTHLDDSFIMLDGTISSGITTGPADPASGGGGAAPYGGGKIGLKYGTFFADLLTKVIAKIFVRARN